MGKLLRMRDYILLGAALVGELSEEVRLMGDYIPGVMRNRYGYVPENYKKQTYLTNVSKMLSTGDIKRQLDKDGKVYLELTSRGKKKYKRKFSLLKMASKKWGGYFMFVMYDIPEEGKLVRDALRRKLTELRFGQLQKSVWISPYHFEQDVRELVDLKGLSDAVFIFSGKKVFAGDIKKVCRRAWGLKEINDGYIQVIRLVKDLKRKNKYPKKEKKKIVNKYYKTLSKDPLLPKELLPKNWKRKEALRSVSGIIK